MLETKKESIDSLLGSINMMGGSSFQNPTVFGTMAALAQKVEDTSLASPPVIDVSPIQAEAEQFRGETKRIQENSKIVH
jgi:hypothetical protein